MSVRPWARYRSVAGDFNGDGRDDLAGLTSAGTILYTTDLRAWTNVPGQLAALSEK